MNTYTPENLPTKGNAKLIWEALIQAGFYIEEMHYNGNLWGRGQNSGYGTWAFTGEHPTISLSNFGAFCGIKEGRVYVQGMYAPYTILFVDTITAE